MSPVKKCLIATSFVALLFTSCDDQRVVGGTTETENMAAARLILVDSLLPAWNHPDTAGTVAILRMDSSNFDFSLSTDSGRDISVERVDGHPLPFRIAYWNRSAARGRLEVYLDPSLQSPGSRFWLRCGLRDSARTDSAKVWRSIPDSQKLVLTSVLVDDFEHPDNILSRLPIPGSWYSFASDSSTKVFPPEIVSAGHERPGNALHVAYGTPSPNEGFIYAGVSLGKVCNFRSLDSIVFWAKGPGQLTFAFDKLVGNGGKATKALTLDSNWTRISISPSTLNPANGIGGNVGWDAIRDSVTNLTFFVSHGTDLWLDEIRLHGVNQDDLK